MPQMHCNFFSYSLGHGVDLTITLPGVSPCDMDDPALLTHQMPEKFPVLYLLHAMEMIIFPGSVLPASAVMRKSTGSR